VTTPDRSVAIMRGEVGLLMSEINPQQIQFLRNRLTLQTKPFMGDPETVHCFEERAGRIWMPRHFAQGHVWNLVDTWEWTEGEPFKFQELGTLDPERGQDKSLPAMIAHLKVHKSGVLVSPTGTGKTLLACRIGANFGRFIGWFAYAGHMVDNAVEHAKSVLGLSDDQIGLVQEDRCDLGRPFTVMMIQSLLARRYPDELYEQMGFIISDEVHRYGAAQWRKVIAQFPAKFRLGVSADPERTDGLGPLIDWTFGRVGHVAKRIRNEDVKPPSVVGIKWDKRYADEAYCSWVKDDNGEWSPGDPHPTKYDKVLAKDLERSEMLAVEIVNAAVKDRALLVFSKLTAHLKTLRKLTNIELESRGIIPSTSLLISSKKKGDARKKEREAALKAQVIFTTFAMARDALNVPKLDTMFFATPPGNALQPIGRLREKSEDHDRKPLLVVDCYENVAFAIRKFRRRVGQYQTLGLPVTTVQRRPT